MNPTPSTSPKQRTLLRVLAAHRTGLTPVMIQAAGLSANTLRPVLQAGMVIYHTPDGVPTYFISPEGRRFLAQWDRDHEGQK